MKRLFIHLCITLLTFITGCIAQSLATRAIFSGAPMSVQRVEPSISPVPKAAPVINLQPTPRTFVLAYDPEEFNPRGDYFILGPKPHALREFDCLELVVEGSQGKAIGDATLSTKYFGNNPDYYITSGNGEYSIAGFVTKERLSFVATSESPEDFQFIFEGHFLRSGSVSDAQSNEAVLRGTLTKLKRGVKVAESTVRFRVEYLGC